MYFRMLVPGARWPCRRGGRRLAAERNGLSITLGDHMLFPLRNSPRWSSFQRKSLHQLSSWQRELGINVGWCSMPLFVRHIGKILTIHADRRVDRFIGEDGRVAVRRRLSHWLVVVWRRRLKSRRHRPWSPRSTHRSGEVEGWPGKFGDIGAYGRRSLLLIWRNHTVAASRQLP